MYIRKEEIQNFVSGGGKLCCYRVVCEFKTHSCENTHKNMWQQIIFQKVQRNRLIFYTSLEWQWPQQFRLYKFW